MRTMTDQYGRIWTDLDSKTCCRCKEYLSVIDFGGITKINDYCKECKRKIEKTYADANRAKRRIQNNEAAARRYLKNCRLRDEFFIGKSCVDCSESDPVVFEFDHIDPTIKKYQIGDMLCSHTWTTILTEIEKCVIRCANCHRRRTAAQLGWRSGGGGAQ